MGTLQDRCSRFYNTLKNMERNGERLDYGCTFRFKNPSIRFFQINELDSAAVTKHKQSNNKQKEVLTIKARTAWGYS